MLLCECDDVLCSLKIEKEDYERARIKCGDDPHLYIHHPDCKGGGEVVEKTDKYIIVRGD